MRNSQQHATRGVPIGKRQHRNPEGRGPRHGQGRRHHRRSEGRGQGPPAQARENRRNRPLERPMDNSRSPRRRGNRQGSPQANFRPRHPIIDRRNDSRKRRKNRRKAVWHPPIEFAVFDDRFEVLVELPGVSQDNINVTISDRLLKIKGEKQRKQSDGKKVRHSELLYGKFIRILPLPPPANADGIKAEYKDGILSIVIPKKEGSKPKEIPINADS